MLYELRKYDVMPGKLPALLDRFGSFTVHKWKENDIRLVGFWVPDVGGTNHQVIYMWAWESYEERERKYGKWQADPERAQKWAETEKDGPLVRRVNNCLMRPTSFSQSEQGSWPSAQGRKPYLFELREYNAMPGRLPNLVNRFGGFTIDAFARYGFRQAGYWTPEMGGTNHQLIYLLAWESYEERTRKFAEFRADPERQRVFAESEKDGQILEYLTNVMMTPMAFSPMQ